MEFTKIPTTTMETIQLNAGILVDSFVPSTGVIGNIIGATTGGVSFTDTPAYSDWGEDIDNCPKNTKELKHIDDRDVKLSGTFVTIDDDLAKTLVAGADVSSDTVPAILPRDYLTDTDFEDIWWVGDYSDKNTGAAKAGFVAIHLINALNTGGFQLTTGDKAKGQFPFEFTGHYSIADTTIVPYELYVKAGTE